jgi:hypothetical protein
VINQTLSEILDTFFSDPYWIPPREGGQKPFRIKHLHPERTKERWNNPSRFNLKKSKKPISWSVFRVTLPKLLTVREPPFSVGWQVVSC